MYESPIQMISEDIIKDIVKKQDGVLLEAVHRVGFDVNKDELEKALLYDRDQYEEGFSDGRRARDSEIVRCRECMFWGESLTKEERNECDVYADLVCTYWMSDGLTRDDFCSKGERGDDDDTLH